MKMNTSAYIIRPYEAKDHQALRRLAHDLWPERDDTFPRRWWWLHENPPIILAQEKITGALAGLCAYVPFSLYHRGAIYRAAWFVDFFVRPEHQRKGLGRLLTQTVMEQFQITASLQQSDAAWGVFQKLGWEKRVAVHRYIYPYALLPGTGKILPITKGKFPGLDCEISPLTDGSCLDRGFDGLWEKCKDLAGPLALRDAAALRKRYTSQPYRPYSLLRCFRGGELSGYMILRSCPKNTISPLPHFRGGLIVDFLSDPDDGAVLSCMLSAAMRYLLQNRQNPAQIIIARTTSPVFHRLLAGHGFLHAGLPLIGPALARLSGTFTFFNPQALIPDQPWHLTLGDCDVDLDWYERSGSELKD